MRTYVTYITLTNEQYIIIRNMDKMHDASLRERLVGRYQSSRCKNPGMLK